MAELSRNDPCSCGSGKKFKKCCMESSKAAAPPRETPGTPMRRENRQLLKRAMDLLLNALDAGRLPQLEVDPARFDALMSAAIAKHGLPGDSPASLQLMFSEVAPQLWPEGLGRAAEVLAAHAERRDVNETDRMIWKLLVEIARTVDVAENPVARALFTLQLERWTKQATNVQQQLREVAHRVRQKVGADASPDQLEAVIAQESKTLAALAESPVGRELMAHSADAAVADVARSLEQGKGYTLLTTAEWAWLAVSLEPFVKRLAAAEEGDREAAKQAFFTAAAKAMDEDLMKSVIERAEDFAADAEAPREKAHWYRRAVAALKIAPQPVLMKAIPTFAVFFLTREPEAEKPYVRALLSNDRPPKEAVEAYRKFLLEHGKTEAAERLGKACAVLDAEATAVARERRE